MKRIHGAALVSVLLFFAGCEAMTQQKVSKPSRRLSASNLRCEYRIDPMGIDFLKPRLSWILQSSERGQKQTAYQVLAASDAAKLAKNIGDLWDSGKVISDETVAVVYDGVPLTSEQNCFWKVKVWDKEDKASAWSQPGRWSMGLLEPADWIAGWIGYDVPMDLPRIPEMLRKAQWIWTESNAHQNARPGNRYFRISFDVPSGWKIKEAVCYFTADNACQLYVNGRSIQRVNNFNVIHHVSINDVIRPGKNTLAITAFNAGNTDNPAGLIAAVRVEAEDGPFLEVVSSDQWLMSPDEQTGWQNTDFDDAGWSHAIALGNLGMSPWEKTGPAQALLPPARYFRKAFTSPDKKIKQARLYATSLGINQLFVNGHRVTQDYFSPGWTDYRKRIYYRTYDVTDMLQSGQNALGATLADGWYAGYVGFNFVRNHFGENLRLMAQLNIEYADGSFQVIATGPDWKASLGPILHADLLQGEYFDARKEMPGWNHAGFDDTQWQAVNVGGNEVNPKVQAAVSEPVVVFDTVKPVSVSEPAPGNYVFNMGQNFAGVIRMKVKGRPGQKIQLRHAERLNPDGTIYTTNLRSAAATDTYICKGGGEEVWQPYFTFHGFQYVELTGLDYKPDLNTILGLAQSSDTPVAGTFECSDPMVNKLQQNSVWTQRMNFIDIPTDCPQRDERLGWTGDAQVYINTACYHNDVQAFFTKWIVDLTDAQRNDGQFPEYAPLRVNPTDGGPAWADAGVICPWTIYKMYGDTRILRTHYDAMKKYVDFTKGRCTENLLPPERFHCFGDWLNINDDTPRDVIFMAYFGYSTKLLANTAEVLGKTDDAAAYNKLFERIKASFNKAYVGADGKIKGDTQAAYVLAIAYDLLDAQGQKRAGEHLVRRIEECNWHLATGFVGTKDLMLALAKINRNDVAYRLLHNDTFPSWGFSIKHGATSIWERWNGWTPEQGFGDPGMNSFAHYSFGAVCQWMFENIGGIQTDGPAFKHIILKPCPGGKLTWAKVGYDSIRGTIESEWKLDGKKLTYKVTIPPNTTATLYLPAASEVKGLHEAKFAPQKGRVAVIELESGSYSFESTMP